MKSVNKRNYNSFCTSLFILYIDARPMNLFAHLQNYVTLIIIINVTTTELAKVPAKHMQYILWCPLVSEFLEDFSTFRNFS